jgi:hypothetical protein
MLRRAAGTGAAILIVLAALAFVGWAAHREFTRRTVNDVPYVAPKDQEQHYRGAMGAGGK